MSSPIVTFKSKREAERLAREIGGEVVELEEPLAVADRLTPVIVKSIMDSYELGYATGRKVTREAK